MNDNRASTNLSEAPEGLRRENNEAGEYPIPAPGNVDGAPREGLSTADIANSMQSRSEDKKTPSHSEEPAHLLPEDKLSGYRDRWTSIQSTFVDEPKDSVEQADSLVADVIQTLAQRFSEERGSLEQQWSGGGQASTEDLRQALQHYRSFFQRLLAA
jgi:hypothetical protein